MKKILKITLPLLLGVFLCVYAYSKFSPEQIEELKMQFQKVDYTYFWISIALGFLSHISRGLRWQYTLHSIGYQPKKINLILSVFIGYLLNLTIPRSGEFSRALVLKRYDNVPFDKSFGTIVSERLIDMLILLTFIVTAFFTQFDLLKKFVLDKISLSNVVWILSVGSVLFFLFVWWLYRSTSRLATRINRLISGFKEGILSVFYMKEKWAFIGHTIFIWLMYFLMFYIVFFSLEETSTISLADVITAFVVGSFAILFTNGGFGAYPFFIAEILVVFGIAYTIGTTLGWVIWIAQFTMILLFGGLSFILLPILNKNK
ncbi:MAG: lysylphosphatidylglycerol synthase transmembrane domain-containing protein [Capnocytophaga sp.]|nr:lysylphosphatidylglycerol synthase transmembrane domain-containing protein [Capnocytophaga sp.]